jgi:hypothetical protein
MRILTILLITAAAFLVQPQSLNAQTNIRLLTGPTSFTGSSNLEDGVQISGTGTYSSQISLSKSFRPYLSLEASVQWGELGLTAANRQNEMSSYQLAGGGVRLHLPYSDQRHLQPWISVGLALVRQSNFIDLLDANGTAYQIWDNGQIYDMAEDAPSADMHANPLMRDYTFETRSHQNSSIGIPVQIGLDLNISSRLFASASLATIIGAEASLNPRPNHVDWLTTAQAGIGIRLGKEFAEPKEDYPEALLLLGDDADNDGVLDSKDHCPATAHDAPVDKNGCALDSDKDGIPDYKDIEPHSSHRRVNEKGVALSEEQWAAVLAVQPSKPTSFNEVFQRIDSPGVQNVITPVNAKGRTSSEMRLLKTFGSSKTTVPVKAKKSKTVPKEMADNREGTTTTVAAAIHAAMKPTFRVQLANNIRDLNMELVTPFLMSGDVVQKFNQKSTLCLVTPTASNMNQAKLWLTKMIESGFQDAHIVGESRGKLIDMKEALALREIWSVEGAAFSMY